MTRLLRSGVINFGNLLPVLNNVYFSITLIILIYSSNQFYRTELFGIDNWYIFQKTEYQCLPESQISSGHLLFGCRNSLFFSTQ